MYYVGVDLGGTNIAVGIVDKDLKIVRKGSVPTNASREGELIIKDMAALTERLLKELNLTAADVEYVGIAAPGTANCDDGIIEYANNLPFSNFPIAALFQKYLPVKKVYVENDANAAALAEARVGVAKGARNSVMITLGTGVGGGIVIDGKIYTGFNHGAGELGHTVIEYNGRMCTCGRRGCWEAYSSATALSQMTREKITECRLKNIPTAMITEVDENGGKVTARTAFNAMKQGDAAGKEVVDMYINYLACGVANMINTFQPDVLSIGGGVCNEKENLLNPLLAAADREQYTRNAAKKTSIRIAALGNDAGILGAACLGL